MNAHLCRSPANNRPGILGHQLSMHHSDGDRIWYVLAQKAFLFKATRVWPAVLWDLKTRLIFFCSSTNLDINAALPSISKVCFNVEVFFICCCNNKLFLTSFFFLKFWRTEVPFVGPLIPFFWTFGNVCPGFQSQGGSLFVCFLTCVILRFTSGSTPADCIEVSMAISNFHYIDLPIRISRSLSRKSLKHLTAGKM